VTLSDKDKKCGYTPAPNYGDKHGPGLRAFYFEDTISSGTFYINGEEYTVDVSIVEAVKLLCNNVVIMPHQLTDWCDNDAFVALMIDMLNQGFWFWVEA
jgi:50S ribosomal protein L16 3-hydroxylase